MAAFAGLAIDNAIVELDNYEVPIMDGSAVEFTSLIHQAGVTELDAPRYFFEVLQPIEIKRGDKFVGVYPSSRFVFTCRIEYDHPLINRQSYTFKMSETSFEREICGARTFGFLHDVETMKRFGLARGGSLNNVVVVDQDKILNEDGLRFRDEFVRHKLLDCIGDFALLGMPMLGHVVAEKSGHAFNHAFLQEFFSRKESWKTRPMKRNV
jgi:UDP-3-O-[3-hydroxymyristoyl] N-acetylglucosamine deacetylase